MVRLLSSGSQTNGKPRGLIFAIGLLLLISTARPATVHCSDPGLDLFQEAVDKIETHSLRQVTPPPPPKNGRFREVIKNYARQTGRYSDYLTQDEFKTFVAGFAPDYCGVGIKIDENREGDILCYPFPHGPAEEMGLKPMDKLVEVDGRPVKGRSVYVISSMIRGKQGTRVTLGIRRDPDPAVRYLQLVRKKIDLKTVYLIQAPIPIIRITSFGERTPKELADILRSMKPGRTKIIDLRGNDGGDLLASVEAASLFLPPQTRILEIRTREKSTLLLAETPPLDLQSPLYIWQDQDTASAAEVFLAALIQNHRALSVGIRSYGKGVSQKPVPLSDGSALFLTFAILRGPDGRSFHNMGLPPDYPVPEAAAKDNRAYMAVIRNMIDRNSKK